MSDTPSTDFSALADEIAGWLRFQMDQVGATRPRLVLGGDRFGGGLRACTMAAGTSTVIPAIMPIRSRPRGYADAELVASAFEVVPRVIDLSRPTTP